jgi:CRP-like cAMP-binding protein
VSLSPAQLLRRFPRLFPSGQEEDAETLLRLLNPLRLPAGEVLIERGDLSTSLYLLASGELETDLTESGQRLILGQVKSGSWVGELALISPGTAAARIRTVKDSTLLVLSHDAFSALRLEHPHVASGMLHTLMLTLVERLRSSNARVIRRLDSTTLQLTRPEADDAQGIL